MFRELKGARWVLVLVGVLISGLLLARNFVDSPPGPPSGDLPTVDARDAGDRIGETVRVCGRVAGATYARGVDGRPTFLNLGSRYPDPEFTAVIWGEHRGRFESPPEDLYGGRRICVRGRLERHEGTPQVEVRWPEQIEWPDRSRAREQSGG